MLLILEPGSPPAIPVKIPIARRAHDEVAAYNARQSGTFQGLGQPATLEQVLNGYRLRSS